MAGRNYKAEYANFHAKPAEKKKRALRNAARSAMAKEGKVHKGDGKDVDHKKPLRAGGGNGRGNLRVMSKSRNRSWRDGKV